MARYRCIVLLPSGRFESAAFEDKTDAMRITDQRARKLSAVYACVIDSVRSELVYELEP